MDENKAKKIVNDIYAKEELFILLSVTRANMISGKSEPYVGKLPDGNKILLVFTEYDSAKQYIDTCKYEVLDGVYTIGRLDKNDKYNNLYAVFNTALSMGIENVDFNPGTKEIFGCKIAWFMEANGLKPGVAEMILSEEDVQKIMSEGKNAAIRINQIPIYQFENKYSVNKERADVILEHVFAGANSFEEYKKLFLEHESLHENCFVADYLNTKMIPEAKANNKNDIEWFKMVNTVICTAVWERLFENELYTLTDRATGKVFAKAGCMYVIYTDLYKYMGQYEYKKINGKEELMKLVTENGIERIIVTDGPHWLTILDKSIFNS